MCNYPCIFYLGAKWFLVRFMHSPSDWAKLLQPPVLAYIPWPSHVHVQLPQFRDHRTAPRGFPQHWRHCPHGHTRPLPPTIPWVCHRSTVHEVPKKTTNLSSRAVCSIDVWPLISNYDLDWAWLFLDVKLIESSHTSPTVNYSFYVVNIKYAGL